MLKLVSAGGVPLSIHGNTRIELQLERKKFIMGIVVVKSPYLGGHSWPVLPSGAAGYHRFGSKEATSERRREGYATENQHHGIIGVRWRSWRILIRQRGSGCYRRL